MSVRCEHFWKVAGMDVFLVPTWHLLCLQKMLVLAGSPRSSSPLRNENKQQTGNHVYFLLQVSQTPTPVFAFPLLGVMKCSKKWHLPAPFLPRSCLTIALLGSESVRECRGAQLGTVQGEMLHPPATIPQESHFATLPPREACSSLATAVLLSTR